MKKNEPDGNLPNGSASVFNGFCLALRQTVLNAISANNQFYSIFFFLNQFLNHISYSGLAFFLSPPGLRFRKRIFNIFRALA
jgi:hypothetical protein